MDINERIKELQKDSKFFFKQTEEIIDIIYRTALQDSGSIEITKNNDRNFKDKLVDALNVIKEQDEKIEEQEKTIKKLNSQIHNLEQNKKKSFPEKTEEHEAYQTTNNQFQSGMISGLKYSIMALEGHNIDEAWGIILKKYNEINKPSK